MADETRNKQPAPGLLVDAVGVPIDFGAELRLFLGDPTDAEQAPVGWTFLRSAREVVLAMILGDVVELSLTNDLGDPDIFGRGSEVLDFLKSEVIPVSAPRDGISVRKVEDGKTDCAGGSPRDMTGQEIVWAGDLRIFLDDDNEGRRPPDGWIQLRSVREAAMALALGNVRELSLDSDLNGDEIFGQGYQVVDFLENQEAIANVSLWPQGGITIHTANPGSRQKMRQAIETVPRRHPHLKVTEDQERPASQPHFLIERIGEGEQ